MPGHRSFEFGTTLGMMLSEQTDLLRFSRNAYDACKREFNWDTQAARLVKVFENLE